MNALIATQSFALFMWLFETTVLKGDFYIMNIANMAFFELLAYTGYKYVILCIVVAAEGASGYYGSYAALGLFGGLYCFFLFMTLKRCVSSNTLADHIKQVSMNKQTVLLLVCASQMLMLWLLSSN